MQQKNQPNLETLKQFPLLEALPDNVVSELMMWIHLTTLLRDEVLFVEGEKTLDLFFVLSGWLKAEKISADGRQQTLRLIGPGEVVNELTVFSGDDNAMSVVAMEDAQIFSLSQAEIDYLISVYPEFSYAIIKNLAKRIQHLLQHVENLSLYPVDIRLARLLLQESQNDVFQRHSWKTQTEIANQLGTVLDVVNRHLNSFAQKGLITLTRNQIIINNRDGLEEIAKG
jgi:CRP/FNR family transcriptional regulator